MASANVRRGSARRRARVASVAARSDGHSALIVPLGSSCEIGAALDGDLGVRRDLDRHVLVGELGDAADDAAGGDDLVALLERFEHRARLLRLLLLRADQQEVEDDEDRDHRQERGSRSPAKRPPAAWA